ncbi:MAG TPA: 1,4-dihydroxy-2-naphthoate octaprenyltransferase [Gemmatimonadaceae bacterium]|jgi:1,4-dihydroxy-2-naphthoate octaprenyltransferase|nr:1,4-dihydroxy-2-naphthoate octaprenyltransferase [Gemmatimonadaceae bacterium]
MTAPVAPTSIEESRRRIRDALLAATKVAVGTHAGEEVRVRMMHPGAWIPEDENARPIVYLASMKTDPKVKEMAARPEVALLLHESPTGEEQTSWEMEVTGRAEIVRDPEERERAKQATMRTSSIVRYLDSAGQLDLLAFMRVTPRFMKHRVFGEIVAGRPPSILDFGSAAADRPGDWALMRRRLGIWKEIVRWPTLTASAASVVVGVAASFFATGAVHWGWAVLTLLAAVALQACTNIKNDLDDQVTGADDRNRTPILGFTGGSRVLQRGLATRDELLAAMLAFGVLSAAIGVYFALAGRPAVLLFGLGGLGVGFVYTGRPLRLAHRGLGELAVAVAFGVGIVCGAAYVQTGGVPMVALAASVPVSVLVALILFMNGFQDAPSDDEVSKRTIVVRLGLKRASRTYPWIATVAGLALVAFVVAGTLPALALLGLAGFPLFLKAARVVRSKYAAPVELVPANAYTAVGHLACSLALAIGLAWSRLWGTATPVLVAVVVVGVLAILYYNRSIGRMARAFYGVRDAVARG